MITKIFFIFSLLSLFASFFPVVCGEGENAIQTLGITAENNDCICMSICPIQISLSTYQWGFTKALMLGGKVWTWFFSVFHQTKSWRLWVAVSNQIKSPSHSLWRKLSKVPPYYMTLGVIVCIRVLLRNLLFREKMRRTDDPSDLFI